MSDVGTTHELVIFTPVQLDGVELPQGLTYTARALLGLCHQMTGGEFWRGKPVVQTTAEFAAKAGVEKQAMRQTLKTLPAEWFLVTTRPRCPATVQYIGSVLHWQSGRAVLEEDSIERDGGPPIRRRRKWKPNVTSTDTVDINVFKH